ncbi:MAG: alkaline phosphatase family protein [Candidatus Micrarchaeota archaeon]|nr:alkaline phosphatase family protein [Candidatus Micrarchaeota archaeon]
MKTGKKLYLIGIDSAPLWLIEKLHKKYKMAGYEKFMESGILKEMESTLPPVTAAAWPTIYTGLEPSAHGVMDFLCIDGNYSKQLIYYNSSKHPPFWDKLAAKGVRSLIVTPAMGLTKSESKNVDMITGWPLEPRYSSKEMERAAKKFSFEGEPNIGIELEKGMHVEEASKAYLKSILARSEMSKYLIEKKEYDLVFVCFTETDRIQHYALSLPGWERSVAPLYKGISDFVEWVADYSRSRGEDAAIMIVSDHGAQPITNKFLINAWLVQNGFAELKSPKGTQKAQKGIATSVKRQIRDRVMKLKIRRMLYNTIPGSIKKIAERLVDEVPDEQYVGKDYKKIYETDFSMPDTQAFAAISFGTIGMIWLNDERFSEQGIGSIEKRRVTREIVEGLKKIKSAEGDRLVINTYDGHEYYGNSGEFIVPDIMFELKENYITDFTYFSDSKILMSPEINRKGDHSRFGIFGIMGGKGIANAKKIGKKKVTVGNIGPTILEYFGDKSMKKRSLL